MKAAQFSILFILLLTGMMMPASYADETDFRVLDTYWGTPGNPIEVAAGDNNMQLMVSVGYFGDVQISNPNMIITLPTGFTNSTGGGVVSSTSQTSISYGMKIDFAFRVSIDNDARPGLHSCSAVIEWATYKSRYDYFTRQMVVEFEGIWRESVSVLIVVHERPSIDLRISPDCITAGRSNNATLYLTNSGEVGIKGLDLTVTTGPGLALVGTDNKFLVQQVAPGETVSIEVTLFVSSTLVGSMTSLTIGASFKTSYGFSKSDSRTITIPVRGYSEVQVVNIVVPASYTQNFVASGTIANTGMITLRSTIMSVSPSEHFSCPSPTFVGDVSVGAQAPFTLQLAGSNVQNGTYPLTLVIEYKDDFGTVSRTSQTINVGIVVRVLPSSVSQPSGAWPSLLSELKFVQIAISLLVGIGVGYLLFGRRKKEAEA